MPTPLPSVVSQWTNHPKSGEIYERLAQHLTLSKVRLFLSGEERQNFDRESPKWIQSENIVNEYGIARAILPSMNQNTFSDTAEGVPKKENSDIVYHEYRRNAYYNVKQYNPMWWNMVGNGEPYDTCGYMFHNEFEVCRNTPGHFNSKAQDKWVVSKKAIGCNRFECPIDYVKACAYQAMKIGLRFRRMPKFNALLDSPVQQRTLLSKTRVNKLLKNKRMKFERKQVETAEEKTPYGEPVHIMVSPSEKDAELTKSTEGYKKLTKKLYRILRKLNVIGGCTIFHPWRSEKETLPEETPEMNVLNGEYDFKQMREYLRITGKDFNAWYVSEHFHIIGYVNTPDNRLDGEKVAKNYKKNGWVVKLLHANEKTKSVVGTALYQLSHAGYRKHTETLNWFGIMGRNSKWWRENAFDEPIRPENKICPICGEKMAKIVWVGEGEPPLMNEPEGIYFIDPFEEYRIVEKLKSDTICNEETTIAELEQSGYIYLDEQESL